MRIHGENEHTSCHKHHKNHKLVEVPSIVIIRPSPPQHPSPPRQKIAKAPSVCLVCSCDADPLQKLGHRNALSRKFCVFSVLKYPWNKHSTTLGMSLGGEMIQSGPDVHVAQLSRIQTTKEEMCSNAWKGGPWWIYMDFLSHTIVCCYVWNLPIG